LFREEESVVQKRNAGEAVTTALFRTTAKTDTEQAESLRNM
jgi:hypothetical protein